MKSCRSSYLNCRLTEKEKFVLDILATKDGRSVSELVREIIRQYAEERGIKEIGEIDFKYFIK